MAELESFGLEIVSIRRTRYGLDWHTLGHDESVVLQRLDFFGIVRHEPNLPHAEIKQDVRSGTVIAHVGGESERMIRLDRVVTFILERVSPDLVEQSDTAAFVEHVDEHAPPGRVDHAERRVELLAAIATLRAENVTR